MRNFIGSMGIKRNVWRLLLVAILCAAQQSLAASPLANLSSLNRAVATHWTADGPGYPLTDANLHVQEILDADDANCAQKSYIFARQALQRGYQVRRIGLFSYSELNDLMVEVKIKNKWYLFNPSAGVYYRNDSHALMSNPKLAKKYVGTPVAPNEIYLSYDFFARNWLTHTQRTFNDIEKNFALDAILNEDGFYPDPYGAGAAIDDNNSTYAAGYSLPQDVELTWGQAINFYRVSIDWYSANDTGKTLELYVDQGSGYLKVQNYFLYKDYDHAEIVLPETLSIIGLKLVVTETTGQQRLLVNEIGVY